MWVRLALADGLVGAGLIWFLQGIRVLPGSFMTGSATWVVLGALALALGVFVQVRLVRSSVPKSSAAPARGRSGPGGKSRRSPPRKGQARSRHPRSAR